MHPNCLLLLKLLALQRLTACLKKVAATLVINLVTELLRWFDGRHQHPIAHTFLRLTSPTLAEQFSDNRARMFRLQSTEAL